MDEQTTVIICGGGPTGALLSALLGKEGVPNVILEREADITVDPRGIVLDEDGIRTLQAIGLYEKVFSEIGSTMTRFNFISGVHSDLYKRPLLSHDQSTSEGGTGHVGFICQKQPMLETAIRSVVHNNPWSQLRSKCLVTGIDEDKESVIVRYTNADGESMRLRGKFLVGCDGKTGFVRKKYLEPKGITMDMCEGTNYDETWVALNWKISLPNEKTHPDFPLWRLGYTPEQVYDLFFPHEFRFLCNPVRPAVCGRFGLPSDRLWRFEFVVHKDEDGNRMATREETQKIIFPYLTHLGSRYGLDQDVRYPEDCIGVLRSRPFSFQARSCNRWAEGRVMLAGDAAHVFPPFGGQGIASGFRDAWGLAWRLSLLHKAPDANYVEVIRAWYLERKQQLDRSLAATIVNGDYVTATNPIKIFVRDWSMWFSQLLPSWRREIEKGPRAQGMIRYTYRPGLPFAADGYGGLLCPQIYVWDFEAERVTFSDDIVFAPDKKGFFQLVVLPDSADEGRRLLSAIEDIPPGKFTVPAEATTIIQSHISLSASVKPSIRAVGMVARVATGEEFAGSILCKGRPAPRYYDPFRLSKEVHGMKYLLVRPDRFVYSACATAEELRMVLTGLDDALIRC